MLDLGGFRFGVSSFAYATLTKSLGYTWAEVERIGGVAALQLTGVKNPTVKLEGTAYPAISDPRAISRLEDLAARGRPQILLDSTGRNLGLWVIVELTITNNLFHKNGVPRRRQLKIGLKFHGP